MEEILARYHFSPFVIKLCAFLEITRVVTFFIRENVSISRKKGNATPDLLIMRKII